MADYVTEIEAENSAKTLMAAGTVVEAHSCRTSSGKPAVRVLRKMSATGLATNGQTKAGGWSTITAESDAA